MKKPINRTASILPKILLKIYFLSKFRGYEEFILVEIADKYMLNNCMTFVSISIYRKTESLII